MERAVTTYFPWQRRRHMPTNYKHEIQDLTAGVLADSENIFRFGG